MTSRAESSQPAFSHLRRAASSAPRPGSGEKGHSPGRPRGYAGVLVLSAFLTMTSYDTADAQVPRDLARTRVLVLVNLGHRGRRPPPTGTWPSWTRAWPGQLHQLHQGPEGRWVGPSLAASGRRGAPGPAPSGAPAHGRPAPTASWGDLGHQVLGLLGDAARDESTVPSRSCSSGAAMPVSGVEPSAGPTPPGAPTPRGPRTAELF